jgi:aerobic carbon-monoxide dehydrogenase medium subunit
MASNQRRRLAVIPASFDYVRPDSVTEAVSALAGAGEDGKLLAGGQSLIPVLRLRLAYPSTLVDISRVGEMRGVRDDGDAILIGAMTTHHEVLHDPLVNQHAPLIAQATRTVADPQVRHRGTFGGSLAHADPAGDLGAVALALEAELVAHGPGGERRIPAHEFFVDYLTTSLRPDEVLTAVRVPKLDAGWTSHYEKFTRVAQAWATVAVAALVRRANGSIAEARVGLTNMGSTPLRAAGVEQALAGSDATADAVGDAAQHAAEGTSPPSDLFGQADYREHIARVMTKRAVLAAAGVH